MTEYSQIQVTEETIPTVLQPFYDYLLQQSQLETKRGYTPYGAQRIAGFTEPEVAAQQGLVSLGLSGGPWQQQMAGEAAAGVGQGLGSMVGGQGSTISGNFLDMPMFTNENIARYQNPYMQQVVENEIAGAQRNAAQQMANLKQRAAGAGAFGGYRHGLLEQGTMSDLMQQQTEIRNRGLRDSYEQAIGMIQADRGAMQQARTGALQGYNQMAGISGLLGNLAAQEQGLQMERLGALQGVGEQQRALQQAGMDIGYQDFLRQQMWPKDQLSFMSSMLRGIPYQPITQQTTSTMMQQPGLFQSILSAGLGGLSMWNAYNQGTGQQQG